MYCKEKIYKTKQKKQLLFFEKKELLIAILIGAQALQVRLNGAEYKPVFVHAYQKKIQKSL